MSRITEILADLTASSGAYGTDSAWLDLGRMGRASRVGDMVVKSGGLADLMRLLVRLRRFTAVPGHKQTSMRCSMYCWPWQ